MGIPTLNNFFYKPALGASGAVEKDKFDNALDISDAEIKANKDAKHTQGTDQGLDAGGVNAVVVADVKDAVTKRHTQTDVDTIAIVKGSVDVTKLVRLEVDGLTTATTRVLTVPDKDLTLVGTVDKLSAFAATTSAELAGVISDETGSGALVFGTSPTLTTPLLNVPSQTYGNETQTMMLHSKDFLADNVISGCLPATSANLTSDISAGIAYSQGRRIVKAITSRTYTASVDTYVDLKGDGTYIFTEVANAAAAPAVAADSIRLAKVITSATAITAVADLRYFCKLATTANKLSVFAPTTSAELAGVISDETGTGALVLGTSPTLVTPVLGTPTSGTLTNCTGLPIAGGGTGQATAQTAINALSAVAGATNEHVLTKDTTTGNAIFKVAAAGGGLGYALSVLSGAGDAADTSTKYFGNLPLNVSGIAGQRRVYIGKAGTIKIAYIDCFCATTIGSSESWSLYIRLNDTTDTLIAAVALEANHRVFANTNLSIAVVAGDYFEIKAIYPTWVTDPVITGFSGNIYIE